MSGNRLTKARNTVKALLRAGHKADDVVRRVAAGFSLTEEETAALLAETLEAPARRRDRL